MKKLTALLLTVLLMVGALPLAMAEIVIPDDIDTSIPAGEPLDKSLLLGEMQRSEGLPMTDHVVAIAEDGTITVTVDTVTVTTVLPFGLVGFTQDVLLQMQQYLDFFNNPRSVVEFLMEHSVALLVYDASTGDEFHVVVSQSGTSQLFHNVTEPKVADAFVALYLESTPEGHERTDATINGQRYVRVLEPLEDGGFALVYLTIANGYLIRIRQYEEAAITPEQDARMVELIEGITYQ